MLLNPIQSTQSINGQAIDETYYRTLFLWASPGNKHTFQGTIPLPLSTPTSPFFTSNWNNVAAQSAHNDNYAIKGLIRHFGGAK